MKIYHNILCLSILSTIKVRKRQNFFVRFTLTKVYRKGNIYIIKGKEASFDEKNDCGIDGCSDVHVRVLL